MKRKYAISLTKFVSTVIFSSFFFVNPGLDLLAKPRLSAVEDLKSMLFKDAYTAMTIAQKYRADVLAPKAFSEAMEHFRKAETDFDKGRNLDDIRKGLRVAAKRFLDAKEATRIAVVVLGTPIQARNDAISAEAPKFVGELYREAEKKFTDAARILEEGNAKEAGKRGDEAVKIFRDAELQAIKVNYLNEAYSILKEAEKVKAKEFAPQTLAHAQSLVKEAERELSENRYDTDVARVLARQAKREATHAIYLATTIKRMRDNKQTWEDLMLDGEKPLKKIGSSVEIIPSFEKGYETPTQEIVKTIEGYQNSISKLNSDVFDNGVQIGLLEQRNTELEKRNVDLRAKLGGIQQEKTALARRLEAQAKIREMYASVEKLFSRDEAIFIREGNDVILRLVGLSFPVGKATIDPKYHDFLGKVQKAIKTFPDASCIVEGHTDSYGSDESNLKLSVERANAVQSYLLANMSFDAAKMQAFGYGESKPVASNESDEGRARNRRIEIIIQPKIEGEEGSF